MSISDIPNLQLWLDAGTLGLTDGASVTGTWTDGAGLGNATASGTLTYRTNVINSQPAVEFDGSSGYFTVSDRAALRFTSRFYMVAVLKTNAISGSGKSVLSKGDNAGDPDYLWALSRSADGGIGIYDGNSWRDGNAGAVAATTSYLLEAWWDGTSIWFFANGISVGTPSDGAAAQTSSENLRIGRQGSGSTNPFDGKLAELILVGNGNADSTGETNFRSMQRIRNYLAAKYALGSVVDINYLAAFNGCVTPPDYSIGPAISADTLTFVKGPGQGTLKKGAGGAWDENYVKDPFPVRINSTTYKLFYTGNGPSSHTQIGAADGADGYAWTKDAGNPVLPRGGSGAWDEQNTSTPYAIYNPADPDPAKLWKMYYSGAPSSAPGVFQIGYAYSADGTSWTKSGSNPLLTTGGSYDAQGLLFPVVHKVGSTWHMFYGGRLTTSNPEGYSICHATASAADGPWTKDAGNPILSPKTVAQSLTSNTNSGSAVVHVGDTSSFSNGEPVFLLDSTNAFADYKIQSIDSSTQITLTATVTRNWTTGNSSSLRSIYYGSVIPRSLIEVSGAWVMFVTAFQQFAGSPFQERAVAATASALDSSWSYDFTRGLVIPLDSNYYTLSAENLAVIADADPTPDTPTTSRHRHSPLVVLRRHRL